MRGGGWRRDIGPLANGSGGFLCCLLGACHIGWGGENVGCSAVNWLVYILNWRTNGL